MSMPEDRTDHRPSRRPLWPWLLLLVLTICAIYSYNRASEILRDIERNMPAALDLFNDLLRNGQGPDRSGPHIDAVQPVSLKKP
jgi:hypothetical protein